MVPRTSFSFRIISLISKTLKCQSNSLLKTCTDRYEYLFVTKVRTRGSQLFGICTRLEGVLKEILIRTRDQFKWPKGQLILSAIGAACVFDWDSERIPVNELMEHVNDIDYVYQLIIQTVVCNICQKRMLIDIMLDDIQYCNCNMSGPPKVAKATDNWQPYIERKDLIIWRRSIDKGLYAYKVFGSFDDVSAEDFLHVQTDTTYRKEWDTNAVQLEIGDIDPDQMSNSQVIYWEVLWPKLFSNRDYVFNRRVMIDNRKQTIIVLSQNTTHPAYPTKPNNHRVSEYWSCMVIRPTNSFTQKGLQFTLTYFDNPGVSVPGAITSWVAMQGMPDFLIKLRNATLSYAETRRINQKQAELNENNRFYIPDPGMEYPLSISIEKMTEYSMSSKDNTSKTKMVTEHSTNKALDHDINPSCNVATETKEASWWSYLLPYHYFA